MPENSPRDPGSSDGVRVRDDAALRISAPGSLPVASLPWPLLIRDRVTSKLETTGSYRWWVLAGALSGMFSVTITITILALSIPRIANEFGARESVATWIVAGPILAFGIVGPTLGKAADIWGHRRVFLISLSLAAVLALATAAAPTMGWLIFLRILGAVVGAGIGPAAMAMINSVFPPERRVQALGYWSLVAAGAPVIGVLLGGVIVEQYGWRWIFLAQAPVTVLAVLFAALVLPTTPRREGSRFDIPGVVTLGIGSIALLLAISLGQTWGWTSPRLLGLLAVVPIMAVAFFRIEQRQPDPLIRIEYMRKPNFRY
ncbi:MAG: MFS transporter, partial [Acidimicrobiales bacterium]